MEGIDSDGCKYLGKYLTTKEIEEEGFEDILYIKVTKPQKMKKKMNVVKKETGKKYNTRKKEKVKSLKIKGNKQKQKIKTKAQTLVGVWISWTPGLVRVRKLWTLV